VTASAAGKAVAATTSAAGWFDPGTISFEWAKAIPSATVTLVIGLLAFMVANGQRRVADAQRAIAAEQKAVAAAKFKLDLFAHRFDVYSRLERFIGDALSMTREQLYESFGKLDDVQGRASFFFGPSINKLYQDAMIRAALLRNQLDQLDQCAPDDPQRPEFEARIAEMRTWLSETHLGLPDRFREYLDFEAWR